MTCGHGVFYHATCVDRWLTGVNPSITQNRKAYRPCPDDQCHNGVWDVCGRLQLQDLVDDIRDPEHDRCLYCSLWDSDCVCSEDSADDELWNLEKDPTDDPDNWEPWEQQAYYEHGIFFEF